MLAFSILFLTLVSAACPARTIQKAKSASGKLATYANTGVNITRDLFHQNLISITQKDKVAQAFIVLADAGIAFDGAVVALQREFGNSPPKPKLDALFAAFDAQVVGSFIAVLQELKLLSNTAALSATIEAIKAAVLIIAHAFGQRNYVQGRIA